MNRLTVFFAIIGLVAAQPDAAVAQTAAHRLELGVQMTSVTSREFDHTDVGFGGRIAWLPGGPVGIEAEIGFYPADFPDQPAISGARVEGLFGVTLGARFNRVRPFARLRPGVVSFRAAPEPIACILIYPPPLACTLASGSTLLALDIGGGIDVLATRRTFVRVDAGDRLVRYPGPAVDRNRRAREHAFFSHDFRIAFGGGLRF